MRELKTIIFMLKDDKGFGLDTSDVKEIIKYMDIKKQKKLPAYIDGTVTLRGNVIPVINMNKQYGYEESQITRKSRIIIQKIKKRDFGLAVDSVTEIKSFSSEDVESTPEILESNNYNKIKYIIKIGEDNLLSVIDPECILADKEYDLIDDYMDK
jgi:purine-binding chemotaxis protein CheW